MAEGRHYIQSLYEVLAMLGVDPSRMRPNLEHESGQGRVLMGMPDTKVAITTEGDDATPFREDGWSTFPVSVSRIKELDEVLSGLQALSIEDRRRRNMETVKNSSRHEQLLVDAVIRHGLPEPDRNCRIDRGDGKELTTPDLAWPDLGLAFFVDGLWWHVTRDDVDTLEMLADEDNRESLLEENRTRAERDGEIRSQLQVDGWVVLQCSDRELESNEGVEKQVRRISDVLRRMDGERREMARRPRQEGVSEDGKGAITLEDLL